MTDVWEFCLSWNIDYDRFLDLDEEEVEALNRAAGRIAARRNRNR